ncbi:MAG: hypothetical protein HPY81_05440 [Firmicutes bacterium]|nr:hypothetical protein [Bacillota bacterium]
MSFLSPTKGRMTWDEMVADICAYITSAPDFVHKIIIGTDSHVRHETCFVTAVVIHRVGKGARYYYRKKTQRKIGSLRQKIFYETALSLEVASKLAAILAQNGYEHFDVEIHLDIGNHGETKELIREVVGMVSGNGFGARIKPDSCGASKVADKHTK